MVLLSIQYNYRYRIYWCHWMVVKFEMLAPVCLCPDSFSLRSSVWSDLSLIPPSLPLFPPHSQYEWKTYRPPPPLPSQCSWANANAVRANRYCGTVPLNNQSNSHPEQWVTAKKPRKMSIVVCSALKRVCCVCVRPPSSSFDKNSARNVRIVWTSHILYTDHLLLINPLCIHTRLSNCTIKETNQRNEWSTVVDFILMYSYQVATCVSVVCVI